MFKEKYTRYNQLAQEQILTGMQHRKEQILHLQDELSQIIRNNADNSEVASYLSYVSSRTDNKPMVTDALPHLDEAVSNTLRLRKIALEVGEMFAGQTRSVLMFGSGSWGANYSVKETSDLDLELIVHEFDEEIADLQIFRGISHDLLSGLQLAKECCVDMVLYRFDYQGVDTMLHFITEKRFLELMSIPIGTLLDGRYGFTEIRNYHRGSHYLDLTDRCSFADDRRTWRAEYQKLSDGWHWINMPYCQIEDGIIYNGIFTEWHQTPPVIVGGDREWMSSQINQLFVQFVTRMALEARESRAHLRFSNILERKNRMPSYILREVDVKASEILRDLDN